jgi:hypothetical protein
LILKGSTYWARNSSMKDSEGRRVYGFFATHLECEEVVDSMSIGLGKTKKGVSFPGWIPSSVSDVLKIPHWNSIEESIQKRFKRVVAQRKKEPFLEYRYYDPETKQRSAFRTTLSAIESLVVSP